MAMLCGIDKSGSNTRSTFLSDALTQRFAAVFSMISSSELGVHSISIWPDSILEKSSMSLMISSRANEESRTVVAMRFWSALSGVCLSSSIMPITPFIGVRISWLMVARNADFASLALWAASVSFSNSVRMRFCSVMSILIPNILTGLLSSSYTMAAATFAQRTSRCPLRRKRNSDSIAKSNCIAS